MELNSKNIRRILLIIFLGVLIFTAFQNFDTTLSVIGSIFRVFSPIISALAVAFVLNVLLNVLENKVFAFWDKAKKPTLLKLKRPVCLALTYIIALGFVAVLILVIIPDIAQTITYLAEKMPAFVVDAKAWIEGILERFNIEQANLPNIKTNWTSVAATITGWISGYSGKIVNSAVNITTSVFSAVYNIIFSLVISVYVLADKEKIGNFTKRTLNTFLKPKTTGFIYHAASKTYDSFSRFIGGQLTEAAILGVLCFIGMTVFRFPNALIISVLLAVTALVPVVGAFVGAGVGFLLIVITNPIKAVFFVLFVIILQQLEGNLIYPKVVGKAVGLPGILVVSAVLVGGNIGGVLGALLAVPTVAVLYTLLREVIDFSNDGRKIHHSGE